jgi:hypothetical protein
MTRRRWTIIGIALAAIVAHAAALANGYVLDDRTLIVDNPYVREASGLKVLLTSSLFAASSLPLRVDYYRPLSAFLNWLSFRIFHESSVGQHAMNIAMHAGIAVLFWRVLEVFRVPRRFAVAGALLFAVHPATPDIVAYLGGRQDMLGWLLTLGAVVLLARARTRGAIAAIAGGAFVLAVFSRESFVLLGVLLPWCALWSPKDGARDLSRAIAAGLGCVVGLFVVFGVRAACHIGFAPSPHHGPFDAIGMFASVSMRFASDLFAPTDLAKDVTMFAASPLSGVIAIAVVLALGFATHMALRRSPRLHTLGFFGLGGLVGTIATHTVLALRSSTFSDRYAYPAVIFCAAWLCALVTAAVAAHRARIASSQLSSFAPALPYLVALVLTPLTVARARTWHDERRLQMQMYQDRPDDPQSKLAYGSLLATDGHYAEALPLCKAFADAYPDSTRADACLWRCYLDANDYVRTVAALRHYLTEHLADSSARVVLLATLAKLGDWDQMKQVVDEWGPDLATSPEVVRARSFIASHPPHP